jgi:hypothetical protein
MSALEIAAKAGSEFFSDVLLFSDPAGEGADDVVLVVAFPIPIPGQLVQYVLPLVLVFVEIFIPATARPSSRRSAATQTEGFLLRVRRDGHIQ